MSLLPTLFQFSGSIPSENSFRMKNLFNACAMFSLVAIASLSCVDNEPAQKTELSEEVKSFLAMRLGSANGLSADAMAPINRGFNNIVSLGGNMSGRIAGDSSTNPGDTSIWENPWQSCATYTELDNADGSHTSIIDYGDGCWEGWDPWKYFMQGKVTSTYHDITDSSVLGASGWQSYKSEYDNYGGRYDYDNYQYSWLMNGYSDYEGEFSWDAIAGTYSGWYSHDSNSEYVYDSILYQYKSKGYSRYDQTKLVMETTQYEYATDDSYYKTVALAPLVFDYTCYQPDGGLYSPDSFHIWVYVSGREEITFKQGEEQGKFIIDYGDGTCDSIITIIENGVRVEVDLSKGLFF